MVDRNKPTRETLLKILDRARWAPSGDNTQPWRFEIISDDELIVHGHDTRDEILYDFDGHASHMAHGALLETIRIAATVEGLRVRWLAEADDDLRKIQYRVHFEGQAGITSDPLHHFIESRCVQRRPMQLKSLTQAQRDALLKAPGSDYTVQLFEALGDRRKIAKLLWDNAYIRLTCPEAYPVHASIIEWGARFSKDRIPEEAVGVDPLTAKLMRWVMGSWARVQFFNRFLFGTVAPRVQLDYLPAIFCSAHALICPKRNLVSLDDWTGLGAAMQRFWLSAAQQGLHLQPEMTPVIFGWYTAASRRFYAQDDVDALTKKLSEEFHLITDASNAMRHGFFCRLGFSDVPKSRSVRLGLRELIFGHTKK